MAARITRTQVIIGSAVALVLCALGAWYVLRENAQGTWQLLRHYPVGWLLAACLGVVINLLLDAVRSRILLGALGHRVRFDRLFAIVCQAALAGNVTPAYAGTGVVEVGLMSRLGVSVGEGVQIVLMKNVFSNLAFILLVAVFLIFYPLPARLGFVRSVLIAGLAVYAVVLTLLFVFSRRPPAPEPGSWFGRQVASFLAAFAHFRTHGFSAFLGNFLVSAAQWLALLIVVPVLLLGFPEVDRGAITGLLLPLAAAQLIALGINFISPTPGGTGVAELAMLYASSTVLPGNLLSVAVLLWRTVNYYFRFLLGGAFALVEVFRTRAAR